jgi:hypothetical protein
MNRDEILAIAEECGIEAWRDTLCRNEGWEEPMIAFASRIESLVREECANKVPSNWLDPLLTGPNSIGEPPYNCQHIEQLLNGIAAAIRKSEG